MEENALPTRWEIELEFVQSLANIQYLNYLAHNNYLNNPEFLNYLDYLSYWGKSEYAKFLVYPNCLHILTLLQSEEFRKSIVNPEYVNTVMNDMVSRWQDGGTTAADITAAVTSVAGSEAKSSEIAEQPSANSFSPARGAQDVSPAASGSPGAVADSTKQSSSSPAVNR